jgi:hypothetical protein
MEVGGSSSAYPQGGPRKVHRRAEDGAVGDKGKKEDGIRERDLKEGPRKGPHGGLKRDLKGASRKLGKNPHGGPQGIPGTGPEGSPGGPRKKNKGNGSRNKIIWVPKTAPGGPGRGPMVVQRRT